MTPLSYFFLKKAMSRLDQNIDKYRHITTAINADIIIVDFTIINVLI